MRRRRGLVALGGVVSVTVALLPLVTLPLAGVERRNGDVVEIAAGEVVGDDLYIAGDTVTVAGTVQGDLIVIARHVRVTGIVEGDAMLAAQAIEIEGSVGDDARLAGQVLRIGGSAVIVDDLVAAGFSLETLAGGSIGGVLTWAGYQAELSGEVTGDAEVASEAIELLGWFGGDVRAEAGGSGGPSPLMFLPAAPIGAPSVTSGLSLGDSAEIAGDLDYTARQEARIPERAIIGGETLWSKPEVAPREPATVTPLWMTMLRRFAELLVLGWLLALIVPAWLASRAERVRTRPLATLGWGAVGLFGVAIACVLVFVVGIVLAVVLGTLGAAGPAALAAIGGIVASAGLTLALVGAWVYLAPVVVAATVGLVVLRRESSGRTALGFALSLGLVVFVLLRFVPLLGWLVGLVVTLLGFGAVFRRVLSRLQQRFRGGSSDQGSPDGEPGDVASPA